MDGLLQDIRHAIRVFRANPVLAAIAVLSLALGIGPNSVLFSLVDAFGFRPLPIPNPGALLTIGAVIDRGGRPGMSYPDYLDLRDRTRLLSSVGLFGLNAVGVSGNGLSPQVVTAAMVTASYFPTLGVHAAVGRTFRGDEDATPGTHLVILISDRFWKQRLNGDSKVLGRTLRLNNLACTIVGVLPAGFDGTRPVFAPEIWMPSMLVPALRSGGADAIRNRARRELSVFARLKDGASLEQARAEIAALGAHLAREYPDTNAGLSLKVDYEQAARRKPLELAAVFALGVVGMILLIACANVAGLLLGRSEARRSEIAVRLALGASRGRLVRQFLTEALLLSLAGAAIGLLLSFWIVRLLPSLVPPMPVSFNFDFRIDVRVLAATLLVALVAVPVFGLLPALPASRPDLVPLLKGPGARPGGPSRRLTPRNVLVVGQIAVSLALLISAALLVRSFLNTRSIDPGFVPRPMVFATMAPQVVGYTDSQVEDFYGRLLERLSATPGVERATMVKHLPLNNLFGGGARLEVDIPGYQVPPGSEALLLSYNVVAPGYFETMGIRTLSGRDFTDADSRARPGVVLINQTMAARFWPHENPLGRHISVGDWAASASIRDREIVGVVQDSKHLTLTEEPQPLFYLPYAQQRTGEMTVVARVGGDARAMIAVFRREVAALDPGMPTLQVTTMDAHMRFATVVERTIATFVGILGGLGLLLSVVGLYGVVSFLVARGTREIGIRMALGAAPSNVVGEVLYQGGALALVGIGLGVALALGGMHVLGGSLYGVRAWDPATYAGTSLLVLLVALAGSYAPARLASRVNPIVALRTE